MEIWTNGTIQPGDALSRAAQILDDYVRLFFDVSENKVVRPEAQPGLLNAMDAKPWDARIEELDFSVRTYNCLKKANIQTIGDLVQTTEDDLMNIRNFGRKSLLEVRDKLAAFGLTLAGSPSDVSGEDEGDENDDDSDE
jgi:DNA-directed RNA polymerase subunit alpha